MIWTPRNQIALPRGQRGFFTMPGGMGASVAPDAGALVKIDEIVTSAGQASVAFSAIPSTYRHLYLVFSGRAVNASAAVQIKLRVNSDSGSNYDSARTNRWGSAIVRAGSAATLGEFAASTAPADISMSICAWFPDYAGTAFQKTFISENADKTAVTDPGIVGSQRCAGFWRSTSAINQIELFCDFGTFAGSSVATLYGAK